jgi:hypothetical protein
MSPLSNGSIAPAPLSALAKDYAKDMTSIRGRRVQRLLRREFAGADHVMIVRSGSGARAVLGLSTSGAAFCATDGTGKTASVLKWLHGATEALETRFDLLKDSLPVVATDKLPFADLGRRVEPFAASELRRILRQP